MNKLNLNVGTLLRWNSVKGYGFIEHKEYKDGIFIHVTAFEQIERKPVIGDVILYKLVMGIENKPQAIDAHIQGVKRLPKQAISQKNNLNNNTHLSKNKNTPSMYYRKRTSSWDRFKGKLMILIFISLIVYLIDLYYNFRTSKSNVTQINDTSKSITSNVEEDLSLVKQNFKCDGRIYCSQMRSREEARFFDANCPGTKMRSTPGEPCKNDSRW